MVTNRLAVDSNAFIAYRAGDTAVRQWIEEAKLLFMPITVMGELLYGAMNSSHRRENEQAVHDFYSHCMPIFVDESVAARYASIRLALKAKGKPIPENDIWIAAACLDVQATLLSQDVHFVAIDGLNVLGW